MDRAQADDILRRQTSLFASLQRGENLEPFPAGLPESDQLLQRVGSWLWESGHHPPGASTALHGNLILATVLYDVGGHTSVIRDLSLALSDQPVSLWLTMAHPAALAMRRSVIKRTGLTDSFRLFPGFRGTECGREMVDALAGLRPKRVFLLHHPEDCLAVAVAAAAREMGSRVFFLHHADRTPSSGLFLDDATIVDLTPRTALFSKDRLGLSTVFLPLVCPDPGCPEKAFLHKGRLRTVLSGGRKKVESIRDPDYPALVTAILETTGGTHLHIGPLKEGQRRRIRRQLRKKGLNPDRFIPVPLEPSLPEAYRRHNVDLVVNTYPRGGAKTAVETMAAGYPMIWHSPDPNADPLLAQMKYPDAPVWRDLEDLKKLLGRIDIPWLERQGKAARHHYVRNHHLNLWTDFFDSGRGGDSQGRLNLTPLSPADPSPIEDEFAKRTKPIRLQLSAGNFRHASEIILETIQWALWPPIARLTKGVPFPFLIEPKG